MEDAFNWRASRYRARFRLRFELAENLMGWMASRLYPLNPVRTHYRLCNDPHIQGVERAQLSRFYGRLRIAHAA